MAASTALLTAALMRPLSRVPAGVTRRLAVRRRTPALGQRKCRRCTTALLKPSRDGGPTTSAFEKISPAGAACQRPLLRVKLTCRESRHTSEYDPDWTSVGFNAARTPGGSRPQRRPITAEMWRLPCHSPISFPFSAQLRARFASTIAAMRTQRALSAAERSVASGGASVAYRIVLSAQAAPHACCCRHRWPRGADARNECGRRLA